MAVDASGNQKSFSTIAFTGDNVDEVANSLVASPSRIIFTNLLETATIGPSVDFQFRGLIAYKLYKKKSIEPFVDDSVFEIKYFGVSNYSYNKKYS